MNKKVTSNKKRYVAFEKKTTKKLNDLTENVKLISAKGLMKDLINKYNILMVENTFL